MSVTQWWALFFSTSAFLFISKQLFIHPCEVLDTASSLSGVDKREPDRNGWAAHQDWELGAKKVNNTTVEKCQEIATILQLQFTIAWSDPSATRTHVYEKKCNQGGGDKEDPERNGWAAPSRLGIGNSKLGRKGRCQVLKQGVKLGMRNCGSNNEVTKKV